MFDEYCDKYTCKRCPLFNICHEISGENYYDEDDYLFDLGKKGKEWI